MTKPAPMDLNNFIEEIYKKIKKRIKDRYKPNKFADEWIDIFKDFENIDNELEILELIIEEVRQRIKSACNFYLRYKDNPELLIDELYYYTNQYSDTYKKLKLEIKKWINKIKESYEDSEMYDKYNEWLFRLAFKSTLGDKNGS